MGPAGNMVPRTLFGAAGANKYQGAGFSGTCREPLRITGVCLVLTWVCSGVHEKLGSHFTLLLPLGMCLQLGLLGLGGKVMK